MYLENEKKDLEQANETTRLIEPTPEDGLNEDENENEFDEFSFDEDGNIEDFDEDEEEDMEKELDDLNEEPEEESDEDKSDTEEESETEETEEDDKQEEEPEVVETKPYKSKKLSPSEIKVINLKKENARLAKERQELLKQVEEKQTKAKKQSIVDEYIEKGYDEDTANLYAEQNIKLEQIEEKQEILDFREEHAELFNTYPEAKQDIKSIIKNSKATGMTPEQICRGLYGDEKDSEVRARNSVMGKPTRNITEDKATRAMSSGHNKKTIQLSSKEIKMKRILEKKFNGGQQISNEEFKRLIR